MVTKKKSAKPVKATAKSKAPLPATKEQKSSKAPSPPPKAALKAPQESPVEIKPPVVPKVSAEVMAKKQREISVSEFFLKNRHLLGFDNPRKALLTTVKEAVDNSLDACEEAGILPEVSVELVQISDNRFRVIITDNGPGIVKNQIPKIFAKLLYGSKFHRLRMSRGQQGIGISAAGMYGQLTTGNPTRITSRIGPRKPAHYFELHIDTRKNEPHIVKDVESDWVPTFPKDGKSQSKGVYPTGTRVEIELEAKYQAGRQSVDEYLQQTAIANPHVTSHYRVLQLKKNKDVQAATDTSDTPPATEQLVEENWTTFSRASQQMPSSAREIQPHPHGIELGLLMQYLKDAEFRTVRSFLHQKFSRVSTRAALEICQKAQIDPGANPKRIAFKQCEVLYQAIQSTRLMSPPTDCLAPIGEDQILTGLKKEIHGDFYSALTRPPAVYRGNPFQIELGLAYQATGALAGDKKEETPKDHELHATDAKADDPIRILRFANRVPLLYQPGACAITKSVMDVDWRNYGLVQSKGALPMGPMILFVHMASVWVPFTSESKEAIASYDAIVREITLGLQELGRRLEVFLGRRRREVEAARKRNYIELYLPHLALGLKQILNLKDQEEKQTIDKLKKMLERTHLED